MGSVDLVRENQLFTNLANKTESDSAVLVLAPSTVANKLPAIVAVAWNALSINQSAVRW
jgi:hypothetical protein